MAEICRKDLLARNLNRMIKLFPKEYNVFPKSWCLPADYGDLQAYSRAKRHKTYILKPESGCQGKGIWVTKNTKEIKAHEHMLCQVYVSKPFLIDGFKFDLRIYVLVTSCDPFRIFVFKDGLARFATQKYMDPTHANVVSFSHYLIQYYDFCYQFHLFVMISEKLVYYDIRKNREGQPMGDKPICLSS